MDQAGLIYDHSRHYLDHLAPFCSRLNWPLIVCEPELVDLSHRFYPDLAVIYSPLSKLVLPQKIISCEPKSLLQASFPGKKFTHFWLPHGHSDKGWNSPFFEALAKETVSFTYGQKTIDFLKTKKIFCNLIRVGNFRLQYFLKHQIFYKKMQMPQGINFLYTPTWDDGEKNNSFWNAFPKLAARLPSNCNLLVKLHPNTSAKFAVELEILMGSYAKQNNIIFLPDHPPVYPILSACDAYIGDMSSIGYDFLAFNKPMYFLNAHPHLPLHKCGKAIDAETFDFSLKSDFPNLRKQLYSYTFDTFVDWNVVDHALCRF